MSHDPYASPKASTPQTQSVSTSEMLFGSSDEAYDNDHKSAGCCACSANVSNLFYGLILIVGTVVAYAAKYASQAIGTTWWKFCPNDPTNKILRDICTENQTIYRVSFTLAAFFLLMTIVTFFSRKFHYESWILKASILSTIFSASFFIPGRFFLVYRDVARWASFLFIAMQVLVIVDFAHSLHENVVKHMEDGEDSSNSKKARGIYLALAFTSLIAFITGIVILYVKYNPCSLHATMISLTLIFGVIAVVLSLLDVVSKGLLPPALLAVYTTQITYQALTTNTTEACSAAGRSNMPTWLMALSFLFAILQIGWMAVRAGQSNRMFVESSIKNYSTTSLSSQLPDENQSGNGNPYSTLSSPDTGYNSLDTQSGGGKKKSSINWDSHLTQRSQGKDDEDSRPAPRHWIFHLSFTLCALYVAMLLTGWGGATQTSVHNPEASKVSFWIKMTSVWASFALYLWTLVAPILFPNRDFS